VRTVFRLIWRREGWTMDRLSFADYERLADLVGASSGAHDLPGGVHARRHDHVLRLERVR
jgi:hypothetical protein